MRIGMVAPVVESVPPRLYGGTERVVSVLTEELVHRGHDVTLFASGDSKTSGRLVSVRDRAVRLDPEGGEWVASTLYGLKQAYAESSGFDLIHNHADFYGLPFAELSPVLTLTTLHGRLDLPWLQAIYRNYSSQPVVSISRSQRNWLPELNWLGTAYNGINPESYTFQPHAGDYLAFLGRISPEKGPVEAIEIAERSGMPLIMAAKIDPTDRQYFEGIVKPAILRARNVEFIGEVDEAQKDALLGGAYAYVFPVDWPEPFGISMVEAMATGTPVIGLARGSVPEVVLDGATGFVCQSVDEIVDKMPDLKTIDRNECRARVESCFSAALMVDAYEKLYLRLAS